MSENEPIYIGNGILEQIKNFSHTFQYTITKESVFNYWMDMFKEFYKEYPYAVKWNYEEFLREILDYYDGEVNEILEIESTHETD